MDLIGPAEPRLLHVERGIEALDRQLRALRRRSIALGQGIWAQWGDVAAASSTATPTTYSGTVNGCTGGLSGITVTITNHATGAPLGTVTSGAGGAFSGTLTITGTVSVDFTGAGTHFVTTTTNVSMTAGTSTTGIAVSLTAATGFICTFGCNTPVSKTLTVTDSAYSSYTATYTGRFSGADTWQTSGVTVNFAGGGGCSAVSGVPVTYTLTNGGSWASKAQYVDISIFNTCPATSGSSGTSTHTLSSSACPPSFSVAFTNAASQKFYGSATAGTYTITWS